MGTMLYAKGIYINRCYDELNLSNPDLVHEIHAEYLRAGADILETNTFGATAHNLDQYGLGRKPARNKRLGSPHRARSSRRPCLRCRCDWTAGLAHRAVWPNLA